MCYSSLCAKATVISLLFTGMNSYFIVDLLIKHNAHLRTDMTTYAEKRHKNLGLDFCVSYQGLFFCCSFQPVIIHRLDTRLLVVQSNVWLNTRSLQCSFWFKPKTGSTK